jgi:lipid-A-disaccharide synthase-like uncharacterized protein
VFDWGGWTWFGLAGESLFFLRLLAQWWASERAKRPVLPMIYWHLSIVGAIIVIVYSLQRTELVLFVPNVVGLAIYLRQAWLEKAHRRRAAEKPDAA